MCVLDAIWMCYCLANFLVVLDYGCNVANFLILLLDIMVFTASQVDRYVREGVVDIKILPSKCRQQSVYNAHGVACQKKEVPILTAAANTNLEQLS